MQIVMVAAEAIPYAKTGGLADVCGTLPLKLVEQGHRCSLFMPAYRRALHAGGAIEDTHVSFVIELAGKQTACRVLKGCTKSHSGAVADVYFIDQPLYFDRDQLYGDENGDFPDNCERFCFFARSVVEAIERLRLPVDIVHAHDWQAGLVPAYHKTNFGGFSWYRHAASVMTIHNLAYQGRFWQADFPLTGLDWQYFNWQQMEFYGDLNLLKTGIAFADYITTVSPSYSREIQTPAQGCGLDGILRNKSSRISGIVNGVDYEVWDPSVDSSIEVRFDPSNWREGKAACKAALQQSMGLPVQPRTPVIGLIGRLAEQKGWDLVKPLMEELVQEVDAQWVILGNGEARFANALSELARIRPDRVAVRLQFSDSFAHQIEAGCDMFLMPSRYEPCGLNQLYSLRYGSVPIVHATGGLMDTVQGLPTGSEDASGSNGFSFASYDLESIKSCLQRALNIYSHQPTIWATLVSRGMAQDWSWTNSANAYESAYRKAREIAAIEGRL
jgi:starch synthase